MNQPETVDRYILAGKFRALLYQFDRAIEIYTEGINLFPDEPRLYRLRGHRLLNQRKFEQGRADLQEAARLIEGKPDEIEYFSVETAQDIESLLLERPLLDQHIEVTPESTAANADMFKSTLHFSVYYHLALANFLLKDYEEALKYYRLSETVSIDDDSRTAVSDWTYMTLLRLGRNDEAKALLDSIDTDQFKVNEGTPLYANRLRLYKGQIDADQLRELASAKPLAMVTAEFAIGQWHLMNGRTSEAQDSFRRLLAEGDRHSFAYLVTERDQDELLNSQKETVNA